MADTEKINIAAPRVMNLSAHPSTLKEGEFAFVLNGVPEKDSSGDPFISNVGANDFTGVVFPAGYAPNGNCTLDNDERCVFLAGPSGGSQIGIVNGSIYTPVADDVKLGFKITHQISAWSKTLFDGTRVIYFTDFNEPMRSMNLDNPPLLPGGGLDIDQIKIFKNYFIPEMDITEVTNNGQLKTAGYFITAQYADGRGNGLTAWFKLSVKIPIFRDSISDAYENITGNLSGVITNKAIKIKFTGNDQSFTHLNIGVIQQIDGANRSFKVATIPIAQEEYIYSGAGTEIAVPIEEMLAPPTVYEKARAVTESDGSLVWVNLTSKKAINYQPYVNEIQIRWQAYRSRARNREKTYKNPLFAGYKQGYRRDEVVPLGVVFQHLDGTESNAHPLVARKLNTKSNGLPFNHNVDHYGQAINPALWDSQIVPATDDVYENLSLERWRVFNTATVEGDLLAPGTDEGLSFFGEMAYWESTDRYPNNPQVWGAEAGQPIRHPKMPDSSVLHIHDGKDDHRTYDQDLYLYHLGIVLPNIDAVVNSMPAEIRINITGWRIVRADRTFDKSIQASGMLFNAWVQDFRSRRDDLADLRLYPNYGLNDLRPDPYMWRTPKVPSVLTGGGSIFDPPGLVNGNTANDRYKKDCFTFLSPDTSLNTVPLSNSELKINAELYGQADCFHSWVDPFPAFKERDGKNTRAALQGTAIGFYNNYKKPTIGHIRRKLDEAMYIPFNSQVSGGNAGIPVWNKGRESSVLLKTSREITNPTVQDRSRFIITNEEINLQPGEGFKADQDGNEGGITAHVKRPTSAYYATVKRNIPNQYGSVSNIKFVDTGYTDKRYAKEQVIFGGDTYITLFSAKRQMPFYNDIQKWMLSAPGMESANFLATINIPGIRYYYKNTGGNPRANSNMMMSDGSGWFLGDDKDLGFLMMFMSGIPVFWSEGDVNADLRYEGDSSWEAFYPSLQNGAINVVDWVGVTNLDKDNAFYHNSDLSGFNNLNYFSHEDALFDPTNDDVRRYFTRAIKSLRSQPEDLYDNWQVYKPLDYYDFPKSRGEIVDVRFLGQSRTFFRMTKSAYVTQLMTTLQASGDTVLLGSGRLFAQDPIEPIHSQLPYIGTQSQWAFNICEFGGFFIGSRGKVFNVAEGFKDITIGRYNVSSWFERNLPFQLVKQIPGIPIDNPYNPDGIGIHSTFDAKHKLWILTKKDYELVNPSLASHFKYEDGSILYNNMPVSLKDRNIFADRSFSIGYSPLDEGWISFYSFVPDMYLDGDESGMFSVISEGGLSTVHKHGNTSRFNNFYGKRYPFIVDYATKADGISTMVHSHSSFLTKAMVMKGRDFIDIGGRTFNKAIVYNEYQCSGLLNLVVQDENKLSTLYTQLQILANSKDIALRSRDRHWNFSDYFDIVKQEGLIFTSDWNNPDFRSQYFIDKVPNTANLDYKRFLSVGASLRGQVTQTRLILDNSDDLKLLFQVGMEGVRASYS